jgi:regulator of replication initiation timing
MTDEEILDRLDGFYERVQSTCQEIHKAYNDDVEFGLVGNQWDKAVRDERGPARLTLTVNRLKQYIYQTVNDYKQSEMTSKVLPHDTSEKDKTLAEIRRGLMRSIERKKGGLTAYNNAAKYLVAGGIGGWQINTRFVPGEFYQEPYIIPIHDASCVFVDFFDCQEPDFSDMRDCVVQEVISKARFKSETGKDPADMSSAFDKPNSAYGTANKPTLTNFWFKEEKPDTLCMVEPSAREQFTQLKRTAFLSDLKSLAAEVGIPVESLIATDPKTGKPIQRKEDKCVVRCAKIAGRKVLDTQEWTIDLIPVVLVVGRKTINNGKLTIEGLIRQSKDAQRSYNFLKSNKTERISLAPKAPFVVPNGAISKANRMKWETANTANHPYLTYEPYDEKGRPIPPPQRQIPISVESALVEEERAAVDEINSSLGMSEASVGKRSNETSGRAIIARAQESDTNNYDFTESMVIGIKYSTKILNKLIPKVYDTERQVSIVGEDDKEKVIMINQQNPDGSMYSMDEGEFDVDYEAGPSSATKQDQFRLDTEALIQSSPGAALVLGPQIIRNSPIRNADETAAALERFANTQVPGLFPDKNEGQPNPQMVSQMQAQMQQMQQQLQQMGPEMQRIQEENAKLRIENQAVKSDKQIEFKRVQIEEMKAVAEVRSKGQDGQVKQTDLALKADKQQHDKAVDRAELSLKVQGQRMDAHSMQHGQAKDGAEFHLKAKGQQHQEMKDRAGFAQAGEKIRLDHEAKKSQQGKPTGGKPGNRPSGKA